MFRVETVGSLPQVEHGLAKSAHDHDEAMPDRCSSAAVPGDAARACARTVKPPRRFDRLVDCSRRRKAGPFQKIDAINEKFGGHHGWDAILHAAPAGARKRVWVKVPEPL